MHECNHEHCHHGEGHHCGEGHQEGHHCHGNGGCHGHGGKREGAGRKCENPRIPFNRRLSEESINKLKEYASQNGITETEALEQAIKNL
ncbi:MAG: hypothetical protein ACLSWI_01095 [Candidatus Gastranaerophilaceae bacterium]